MALFRRMVRFSKSHCSSSSNCYSFFSPSSSGHRLNYGRISQLVNPEGSIKFYCSFPSKASDRIAEIVKPDGEGGYYVDKHELFRSLEAECFNGECCMDKLAEKKKEGNPRPWLRAEAKRNRKLVGKSKYHLDKVPFGINSNYFSAYLEASMFDMGIVFASIFAFTAFGVGAIELALRT